MAPNVTVVFLCLICAASLIKIVQSQDACERITSNDLGDSTMLSETGLIADILSPAGQGSTIVSVRVINMNIVCEAQHMMESRYRYTSVVVSFNCFTTDNRVPECMDNNTIHTEQFDLGCSSGQWTRTVLTVSDSARTTNLTANLTTQLDTGCILCINPTHPAATGMPVDNVTHCVGCSNCTTGLQRCFYDGSSKEVCCNYISEGTCVAECQSPLVPGADFKCGNITGCAELNTVNGNFGYTNNQLIGSAATLTCDPGFEISGTNPVLCQATGEWTGMPTCQQTIVTINPAVVSGCGMGCVIGVVVTVGVLMLVAIIVITIFAYVKH